ncbi:MAG: glycoside hydrolase family 88 protein [Phycisphaeraceae bacterium]|nr:glycoside hydrolase family 88 protein [Phycisphaeraceae bacterium]
MKIDTKLTAPALLAATDRAFEIAEAKVPMLDRSWNPADGTPVFTVKGRYTTRGWTEWTQGFQYGCALLTFEATGRKKLLELGRKRTVERMAPHITHIGVHDHGFNNLSTYGNLRRMMLGGAIRHNEWELKFYELAIMASGAVQAARWSTTADEDAMDGGGYIHSFNGPHSLFVDTMRSLRILGVAHQLGHSLMGENDRRINLLGRAIQHALTTIRYIIFPGDSGHTYDVRGRTAHEAVFNRNDGRFRCRGSQQGYSPFSTWTRGLSWAMLGFAEQLEFLEQCPAEDVREAGYGKAKVRARFLAAAKATCDHYINDCTAQDGICYWDDGAPGLARMPDWRAQPADPFNAHEPVDSSASAIAAQGLIRLGLLLGRSGKKYLQAGLTTARTLLDEPYLSTAKRHQGLLLHTIYHWPNHWDHVPAGSEIPYGESCMWGDYHLLELALLIRQLAVGRKVATFFSPGK